MRPVIEALDEVGRPHLRMARVVDDLPSAEERRAALELATMAVARQLGIPAVTKIGFGSPVHVAFGLTRPQAKQHDAHALLLTLGALLSLDYCDQLADETVE